MSRYISIVLLLSFGFFTKTGHSQKANPQIEAINNYVQFTNESIHGLLIVHRLLENFNQDINKYVDLEGQQINFYSNRDIQFNIFEDPEHWFYDKTPAEWYNSAKLNGRNLPKELSGELFGIITEMQDICTEVNKLRFDLETTINSSDLTDRLQLGTVYDQLERGVSLYDEFWALTQQLKNKLDPIYLAARSNSTIDKELYHSLASLHDTNWNLLQGIREKRDGDIAKLLKEYTDSANDFANTKSITRVDATRRLGSILNRSKEVVSSGNRFYKTAEVDPEYKLYGKFYFYHNSDIINKYNRYGNGYVFEMNKMIEELDWDVPQFLEIPHYFKVIYPKKMNELGSIASTDSKITLLPRELKSREIREADHIIKADTTMIEIKLYDNMIQDDDIISLNFNGDWVLEKESISDKPIKLNFVLNQEGKNFLLLHADDVGKRPPATIALEYKYGGSKERLLLKSDLKQSELIEIVLDK